MHVTSVYLVYVDDFICFTKYRKYIGEVIKYLQKKGSQYNWYIAQGKSDIVEYVLGIEIHPFIENRKMGFRMTKKGLLNNIIITLGIYGCNNSTTHTDVEYPLGTDATKKPTQYQYQWNYSSGIIIMMYVTSNSYPDIAFYIHQCGIFTNKPKHSYEKEVLIIYKYL